MTKKSPNLLVMASALTFTWDLTKELKKDFKITVLAPHGKGLKFSEKKEEIKINRFGYFYPFSLQKLAYGGGIPDNLKRSFLAKIQVPFFVIFELISAIKIVKKEKIDLVQSHWLVPQGLVGAIIQKYYKIPHVATIHSSEVTLLKKIPFGAKICEFIFKNSTRIVSVSEHRIKELLKLTKSEKKYSKKVKIIPMGIYLNDFKNKNQKSLQKKFKIYGFPIVLFVGRLIEVKGIEYLITAFKNILKKLPDANLVIVGSGPLEKKLREQALDLKIEESVYFQGAVQHKEVPDYFGLADVVAFPSIVSSSGYQEGLPVVLLEALSSGKPVVSTDIKGAKEVIKDGKNGFLVKQKDADNLAKKIIEFSTKNSVKIGKMAQESVREFDWKNIGKRYSEVLKKTISL